MIRRREIVGWAFISPWILGFIAFRLGPFLASVGLSFTRYNLLTPPKWVGTANYHALLADDPRFVQSLGVTLRFALMSIPVGTVVALGIALLLNANVRGVSVFRAIVYLPSILPTVATAIVFVWLLNPETGLVNVLLGRIGVRGPDWLHDTRWALPSLVFMGLWSVGGAVVIYLAGLKDVPTYLYEAAMVDGASAWQRACRITLPMLTPVVFFNVTMATIGSLQAFTEAYVTTGGGPEDSTLFVALYLWQRAWRYLDLGYASAMAWILFLLTVAALAFLFATQRRWVYDGR